jgi:hypothetical protein
MCASSLTLLDEPDVLGEATRVEEDRHPALVAHRTHGAQVLERDGLAAARIVRDRHEHHGHVVLLERLGKRLHVHTALERMA